jgi:hypothetical protein
LRQERRNSGISSSFRSKQFLLLAWLALSAPAFAADPIADATARYLAGLPVTGTALESHAHDPGWAGHAAELDRAWAQLEQRQLAKIRDWAPQFLGDAYQDEGPMYYMFSGPDFLYANAFYPRASTYILCGIEPVGPVPDIDKIPRAALPSALANLRKSLDSMLNWSFFITKHMKADLRQKQLSGTLPVLYVFLARLGCTIDSVEPVALDRSGNFVAGGKGTTPGVKIVFTGREGREQTLYYFTSDLANWAIKTNPGFSEFCERQGDGVSLLKAASYLMHAETFSQTREFLLTHSKLILQDDSGIPLRFFDSEKWVIRYCGRYAGPIDTFKKYAQPGLAAIYVKTMPVPIEFGFGYRWQTNRASLMIARRKSSLPEEEAEEPPVREASPGAEPDDDESH